MNSNRLPLTSSRPMTRGLQRTALKTASRRPGNPNDKSYWIGQIRSKHEELKKETVKIQEQTNLVSQEYNNYALYEKKYNDNKIEIEELQLKLKLPNLILEKSAVGLLDEEIYNEINNLKLEIEDVNNYGENLFANRRNYNSKLSSLLAENNQMEEKIDLRMKSELNEDKYLEMKKIKEEIILKESEYKEIENYNNLISYEIEGIKKTSINNNPEHVKFLTKYEQLTNIKNKLDDLEFKITQLDDPIKEQTRLEQQNETLTQLCLEREDQLKKINEKSKQSNDLYKELLTKTTELNSDAMRQMKKLLSKQSQLQKTLTEWQETETDEKLEIENLTKVRQQNEKEIKILEDGIKKLPELASKNLLDSAVLNTNDGKSFSLHLQSFLIQENKILEEDKKLNAELDKIEELISKFKDKASLKEKYNSFRTALETEKSQLRHDKNNFDAAIVTKSQNKTRRENLLKGDGNYKQILELQNQYKILLKDKFRLKSQLEELQVDYTPVRNKCLQEQNNYNDWLKERLSAGLGVLPE